jgi:hypothetical protein
MKRLGINQLDPTGGTPGQMPTINPAGTAVEYADSAGIQSIVPGAGIAVDSTDPANPVVSATGGVGSGELLMQDGITAPPVPIETEAGDDWLYQD